jgi:hypothetical protein
MVEAATKVLHESGYLDYCSNADQELVREMLEAALSASTGNVFSGHSLGIGGLGGAGGYGGGGLGTGVANGGSQSIEEK